MDGKYRIIGREKTRNVEVCKYSIFVLNTSILIHQSIARKTILNIFGLLIISMEYAQFYITDY